MMVRHLDNTLRGASQNELTGSCDDIQERCGLRCTRHKRNVQIAKEMEAEQMYVSKELEIQNCNARQAFQKVKGKDNKATFTDVKACDEEAPNDINVYTDGSHVHNRRVHFSLSGAGVWRPKRNLEEELPIPG